MAHYLFINWHGGGNFPPAMGIAQELKERGHLVTFAGYESQQYYIMDRGFPFTLLDTQSRNWMSLPPEQRLMGMVNQVWACPDHLYRVPELVDSKQVDAVLVDRMMYAAQAALENLDLPYAVLATAPPGFTQPGCGFDQFMLSSINAIRAEAGRQAISSSWESWSNAQTVICGSLPQLDPLAGQVPPTFHYVGPVFEHVPPSGWRSPWATDDPRPLVLVSFSTHAAWDQSSRILRSLEALAGNGYRVLVTAGMSAIDGINSSENVVCISYLPHAEIMPDVKVVVSHAGHSTVTASLEHGVPMVFLPNKLSDQPEVAAQVEALGAGLVLDGDNATVEEITQAVERVLSEPSYRTAAQGLANAIKAAQGAKSAAKLMEQLI
jgi:UDP:flavonoid glycosyltransferase YjiC (YdhE family)